MQVSVNIKRFQRLTDVESYIANPSPHGFYVEKWGGEGYQSVAWYGTWGEAEAERVRIELLGSWQGKRPIVSPAQRPRPTYATNWQVK